ncbi:3'-5' exonuclease [Paraclostridium sordellii]|uniref:3'-5' exonuclease n=1 Tax=Paraclostridium sordellii TaxID=1505 RepID=UPI0005DF62CE|nr:3'-5' exonuclease [Paeniclostridium sordellii]CEN22621.1 exonuclease [[Clostridium] sordellii] [Paeniclostridium sordellii]CEN95817.1 exonuclease [[Clostridium] sordellii] [Paeniclostridium sordellii]
MEYIVFDFEFNQGFDKENNKTFSDEKCPFEIIQIGAIKLDSNFNIIDRFNSFVKPNIYKDIHPFVGKMTHITIDKVIDAPSFSSVYKDFKKFISNKSNIMCVWGSGDLKELYRNINYYSLPTKGLPKLYINVQQYASVYFNNPTGQSIGLQNAVQMLQLEQDKAYHDALNDAYYTSLVLKNIYNENVAPDTYIYTPVKPNRTRSKTSKKKVDYASLFEEFKKILDRDLTSDDRKIIDLAYKMGKTNQFLIDDIIETTNKSKKKCSKSKPRNGLKYKKRR